MAAIVGLLSFAGPAALGAIFSVGVIGQYVADSVPIVARFWGGQPFKPGPFHLGRFVRIQCAASCDVALTNRKLERPGRCCRRSVDVVHDDHPTLPDNDAD